MTKDEIIEAVVEDLGEESGEAHRFVDATLKAIADALVSDGRVTLGDFGIFSLRHEGDHITHVPGQEAPVDVPAQVRVLFHPAPALRAALNAAPEPGGEEEPAAEG